MTLAAWSFRKMPLQVPQEPIITKKKTGGGVTTPAPLAVPDQYATARPCGAGEYRRRSGPSLGLCRGDPPADAEVAGVADHGLRCATTRYETTLHD